MKADGLSIHQLTLKQLRAFVAVYRAGQISAAAKELNVTQSAVSVLVRQIETVLGTALFDRTTRSLVPTIAGENAIGMAERILGDVSALDVTLRDLRNLQHGTVRLTATPATGRVMLPATVRRYRQAFPAVSLILDDCAPNQFLSHIREEKVEFGVGVPLPHDHPEFASRPFCEDAMCIVAPRGHRLAGVPRLEWRDLDGEPLILSRRDYGVRDLVESTLRQNGIQPRIGAEIGFLSSAIWLASCGIGICILPERLARLLSEEDLVVRPLQSPLVMRATAVVTKRGRSLSPPSERFVQFLQEDFAAHTAG